MEGGGEVSLHSVPPFRLLVLAKASFSRTAQHYTELPTELLRNSRGSSNLRLRTKKNRDQKVSIFLGGGGEIRTPATGLPILTI